MEKGTDFKFSSHLPKAGNIQQQKGNNSREWKQMITGAKKVYVYKFLDTFLI